MKMMRASVAFLFIATGIVIGQASLQKKSMKKIVQGPYPLKEWKKQTPEEKRDKIAKVLKKLSTQEITFAIEGYDQKIFNLPKKDVTVCKSKTYGTTTAIGFTLYNKSDKPIWIGLINGSDVMIINTKLDPNDEGRAASYISTNKPSIILIWDTDPRQVKYSGTNNKPIIEPAPKYTYHIAKGKTIYVVWDGTILRPSHGMPECTTMTHTGFTLNNNIEEAGITKK